MFFTLFEARNYEKSLYLELNKNGNMYVAVVWKKENDEYLTVDRYENKHYASAKAVFDLYCIRHHAKHIKEVDNSDVYAYIASQYD